jgi:hypothetical protein
MRVRVRAAAAMRINQPNLGTNFHVCVMAIHARSVAVYARVVAVYVRVRSSGSAVFNFKITITDSAKIIGVVQI